VTLARRLAIAASVASPGINDDDALTVRCLEAQGAAVEPVVWNDPGVDWSTFDAVLMRSIWDYHEHYEDFLAWLARLDACGVPTINCTELLRWNSNKRYLLQLPPLGVDIVPTQIVQAGDLVDAVLAMRDHDVVIKPTVSASAWCTVRGRAGAAELRNAIASLPPDLDYMLQPYVREIADEGEWSLLFFDGEYSHAVLKRPAANDYRVQREFGGSVEFTAPDDATIAAAQNAATAVKSLGYDDAVYARIDGVRSGGSFLIMEVEMIEPFLFLEGTPGASERFSAAILQRLWMAPPGEP
jgi:glutathione synthase/RimK-type ligase-like ATP-grasp enzyme